MSLGAAHRFTTPSVCLGVTRHGRPRYRLCVAAPAVLARALMLIGIQFGCRLRRTAAKIWMWVVEALASLRHSHTISLETQTSTTLLELELSWSFSGTRHDINRFHLRALLPLGGTRTW